MGQSLGIPVNTKHPRARLEKYLTVPAAAKRTIHD
jgi:hypothetical protein